MTELEQAEQQENIQSAGEILRLTREAQGLSVEDVSAELRLSVRQVQALENNDQDALPDAMITRGFIRNYGRLLKLDTEMLIEAYHAYLHVNSPKAISIPSANILIPGQDKPQWHLYTVVSGLIVFLVLAWVVYMDYVPKVPDATAIATMEPGLAAEPMTIESGGYEPPVSVNLPDASIESQQTVDSQQSSDPQAEVASVAESTMESAPAATEVAALTPAGAVSVTFRANEETWVNVTDGKNQAIFDRILVLGSEETVRGIPPLQVVVGNAPNTVVTFKGQTLDLTPFTRDRVARMKLE